MLILPMVIFAQKKSPPDYPRDYFRNPLDIPIFLAGNFGECRPGHFHSGLDIKTQGGENQPVHAAAEGYISRIKMEKGGFGHAIYIVHPNGYTTLYAHLNKFAPALQQYVEKEQYARMRWDVDLQFSPLQFPVKKGLQIAWSGNTGASTAPHLHFEIRDTKTEHPLNPQLFGFELIDNKPPVPVEVVLYTGSVLNAWSELNESIYEGNASFISIAKKDNVYMPVKASAGQVHLDNDTVSIMMNVPIETLGVGINIDDYMDGSDNTIAFYKATLYLDDRVQAEVTMDNIGYDESRYINAYVDYQARRQNRKWIQLLFQQPGNRLGSIFSNLNAKNGRLSLPGDKTHLVKIVVTDDKGNTSNIAFNLKTEAAASPVKQDCNIFYAYKANEYTNEGVSFTLDDRQLYDDICFKSKITSDQNIYSDKFTLHTPDVPLHHYFDLKLKPNKTIPPELEAKVVIVYSDGKDQDGRAAVTADNGWYKAKVRNFGTYWLDIDTIPPVIESMQRKQSNLSRAKQISFTVRDNVTSVKAFSGYLDGKWICFEQHGDDFFYTFDGHCSKGKHKLIFKAEDENGNAAAYELNFTR
jgi:Peptidase family M23